MEAEDLLRELEECAQRLGVEVRRDKGDFEGGLCRIGTERRIYLNEKAPVLRQVRILARELAQLGADQVYLVPAVRDLIDEYASEGAD